MLKVCTKCCLEKPLGEFSKHGITKDGYSYVCKACNREKVRLWQKHNTVTGHKLPVDKRCPVCGETKLADCFHKNSGTKDGLDGRCMDCNKMYAAERKRKNLARLEVKIPVSKECPTCHTEKPACRFSLSRQENDGLSGRCHDCVVEDRLRRRFGIDFKWVDKMLASQGGCAICGRSDSGIKNKRFSVDHDHCTGKVRGVLCHLCNVGLGIAGDSVEVIEGCIQYIGSGGPPIHLENFGKRQDQHFKYHLKITQAQKDIILSFQGNCCGVCGKQFCKSLPFKIDHCHTTGRVRGFLCDLCNKALGCFKDSVPTMTAAVSYLKAYQVNQE